MSDTETESEQGSREEVKNEMMFIAEKVKAYPEILEKSQVPTMKRKKTAALKEIVKDYVTLFGEEMDMKAFMKKVNNMKTRLKKKTDKNKTGNKPIRLLSWEKLMLTAMNADINPVLNRVPGALAIGVPTQPSSLTPRDDIVKSDAHQNTVAGVVFNKRRSYTSVEEVARKRKPSTSVCEKPEECDETRALTTSQLQRLVLVEQLKVARIQQQYFSAKLKKLDETSKKESSERFVVVEDQTYCKL